MDYIEKHDRSIYGKYERIECAVAALAASIRNQDGWDEVARYALLVKTNAQKLRAHALRKAKKEAARGPRNE